MSKSKSPPPAPPPPVPVPIATTRQAEPITRGAVNAETRDRVENNPSASLLATGQQQDEEQLRRAALVS